MTEGTETQPCGCITQEPDLLAGSPAAYIPCLACALKNSGLMLVQAGLRMEEAIERERKEAAARAEEVVENAQDWIGGTD